MVTRRWLSAALPVKGWSKQPRMGMPTPATVPSSEPIEGVETVVGVTVVLARPLVVGVLRDGGQRAAGAVGRLISGVHTPVPDCSTEPTRVPGRPTAAHSYVGTTEPVASGATRVTLAARTGPPQRWYRSPSLPARRAGTRH